MVSVGQHGEGADTDQTEAAIDVEFHQAIGECAHNIMLMHTLRSCYRLLSDGVLLGSINIVAIMIAGRILFNEKLAPLRVAGIVLVSIGVAVVGLKG